MKTKEQKRAEILSFLFETRGKHAKWSGVRWSWKNSPAGSWEREQYEKMMNAYYCIADLQEAILRAMEIEPDYVHEDDSYMKVGRRGRSIKVHTRYVHYTAEQKQIADPVIRNMAAQGFIELKLKDAEKNIWVYRILRTR